MRSQSTSQSRTHGEAQVAPAKRATTPAPDSLRPALLAAAVWAIVLFTILIIVRGSYWWIGGDDAYYHVRVAAYLREQGVFYVDSLPWARFSEFGSAWGDKELLFHWLLIPFVGSGLVVGAKAAHTLLNALAAALVAFLGVRVAGRAGWAAPLITMAVTSYFTVRMDQLRPHLLSLVLLLVLAHEVASRRRWSLVVLGFVYALSYTAWQFPLILCAGVFVAFGALRREWRWPLLWAPLLGIVLGVLAHPGFPDNVHVWFLQNVAFFLEKGKLSVAGEAAPLAITALLRGVSAGLLLAAAAAVLRWPWAWAERLRDLDIVLGVFAAATLLLLLTAVRFVEYAVPFGSLLALVFWARLAPGRLAQWAPRATTVMLMAAVAFAAVVHLRDTVAVMRRNHLLSFVSVGDVLRFGRTLPEGAKVAATWDYTPFYLFAAPQAKYVSVLDPVFTATRFPELNALLDRIYDGRVADVPAALAGPLDSDYIAYNGMIFSDLRTRADRDPRLVPVFESLNHRVARVDREHKHGFVTDWRVDPIEDADYAAYRVARDTVSRGIETPPYNPSTAQALVTPPAELQAPPCWWASRDHRARTDGTVTVLFGSAGPADVYVDGRRVIESHTGHGGLIDAARYDMQVRAGEATEWVVRSCTDSAYGAGFFWRVLEDGIPVEH